MKKVFVLQYRLLHYRVKLFELLRSKCRDIGVDLHVVHGQPTRRELPKNDVGRLDWAEVVNNKYVEVGKADWLWQQYDGKLKHADLIIMMQESRLISNYPIVVKRLWSSTPKTAYWGHGANFQSDKPNGLLERWKRLFINKVDWWFAYTQASVDLVEKAGFPLSQTTCLNNAIDNDAFNDDLRSVSEDDIVNARKSLGIKSNARCAIFCGSLYPEKKLDFLLDSVDMIQEKLPDFHCIVLGDGALKPMLLEAARTRPWLHILGMVKGRDKALYFKCSDIVLNPGLVGLHIVDAFCAGLPLITTADAKHSPEIAYLVNGVNGVVVDGNIGEYAAEILDLLGNTEKLRAIKNRALEAAGIYTLDNMADNFCDGIQKCLEL